MFRLFLKNHFLKHTVVWGMIASFVMSDAARAQGLFSSGRLPAAAVANSLSVASDWIHQLQIPSEVGQIQNRHLGKTAVLIHIQDSHANVDAQRKIAQMLARVAEQSPAPLLIAVEGVRGPVSTALLRSFPDETARRQVADALLQDCQLTGPEYYSLFAAASPLMYGVEDPALYAANRDIFNQVKKEAPQALQELQVQLAQLKKESERLFSPKHLRFLELKEAYEKGNASFQNYAQFLGTLYQLEVKETLPEIFTLAVRADALGNAVHPKSLHEEMEALFAWIEKNRVKEETALALEKGVLYKLGRLSALDYFSYLNAQIPDPGKFPHLVRYAELMQLQEKINPIQLNDVRLQMEEKLEAALQRSDEERALSWRLKIAQVKEKMARLEMSPADLAFFEKHRGELQSPIADLAARFYATAQQRDKALLDNTLALARRKPECQIILVTGGFHTQGMIQLLEQAGHSYAVLSPKLTQKTDDDLYFKRMNFELSPLDKMLLYGANRLAVPTPHAVAPSCVEAAEVARAIRLRELLGSIAMSLRHQSGHAGRLIDPNRQKMLLAAAQKALAVMNEKVRQGIAAEKLAWPGEIPAEWAAATQAPITVRKVEASRAALLSFVTEIEVGEGKKAAYAVTVWEGASEAPRSKAAVVERFGDIAIVVSPIVPSGIRADKNIIHTPDRAAAKRFPANPLDAAGMITELIKLGHKKKAGNFARAREGVIAEYENRFPWIPSETFDAIQFQVKPGIPGYAHYDKGAHCIVLNPALLDDFGLCVMELSEEIFHYLAAEAKENHNSIHESLTALDPRDPSLNEAFEEAVTDYEKIVRFVTLPADTIAQTLKFLTDGVDRDQHRFYERMIAGLVFYRAAFPEKYELIKKSEEVVQEKELIDSFSAEESNYEGPTPGQQLNSFIEGLWAYGLRSDANGATYSRDVQGKFKEWGAAGYLRYLFYWHLSYLSTLAAFANAPAQQSSRTEILQKSQRQRNLSLHFIKTHLRRYVDGRGGKDPFTQDQLAGLFKRKKINRSFLSSILSGLPDEEQNRILDLVFPVPVAAAAPAPAPEPTPDPEASAVFQGEDWTAQTGASWTDALGTPDAPEELWWKAVAVAIPDGSPAPALSDAAQALAESDGSLPPEKVRDFVVDTKGNPVSIIQVAKLAKEKPFQLQEGKPLLFVSDPTAEDLTELLGDDELLASLQKGEITLVFLGNVIQGAPILKSIKDSSVYKGSRPNTENYQGLNVKASGIQYVDQTPFYAVLKLKALFPESVFHLRGGNENLALNDTVRIVAKQEHAMYYGITDAFKPGLREMQNRKTIGEWAEHKHLGNYLKNLGAPVSLELEELKRFPGGMAVSKVKTAEPAAADAADAADAGAPAGDQRLDQSLDEKPPAQPAPDDQTAKAAPAKAGEKEEAKAAARPLDHSMIESSSERFTRPPRRREAPPARRPAFDPNALEVSWVGDDSDSDRFYWPVLEDPQQQQALQFDLNAQGLTVEAYVAQAAGNLDEFFKRFYQALAVVPPSSDSDKEDNEEEGLAKLALEKYRAVDSKDWYTKLRFVYLFSKILERRESEASSKDVEIPIGKFDKYGDIEKGGIRDLRAWVQENRAIYLQDMTRFWKHLEMWERENAIETQELEKRIVGLFHVAQTYFIFEEVVLSDSEVQEASNPLAQRLEIAVRALNQVQDKCAELGKRVVKEKRNTRFCTRYLDVSENFKKKVEAELRKLPKPAAPKPEKAAGGFFATLATLKETASDVASSVGSTLAGFFQRQPKPAAETPLPPPQEEKIIDGVTLPKPLLPSLDAKEAGKGRTGERAEGLTKKFQRPEFQIEPQNKLDREIENRINNLEYELGKGKFQGDQETDLLLSGAELYDFIETQDFKMELDGKTFELENFYAKLRVFQVLSHHFSEKGKGKNPILPKIFLPWVKQNAEPLRQRLETAWGTAEGWEPNPDVDPQDEQQVKNHVFLCRYFFNLHKVFDHFRKMDPERVKVNESKQPDKEFRSVTAEKNANKIISLLKSKKALIPISVPPAAPGKNTHLDALKKGIEEAKEGAQKKGHFQAFAIQMAAFSVKQLKAQWEKKNGELVAALAAANPDYRKAIADLEEFLAKVPAVADGESDLYQETRQEVNSALEEIRRIFNSHRTHLERTKETLLNAEVEKIPTAKDLATLEEIERRVNAHVAEFQRFEVEIDPATLDDARALLARRKNQVRLEAAWNEAKPVLQQGKQELIALRAAPKRNPRQLRVLESDVRRQAEKASSVLNRIQREYNPQDPADPFITETTAWLKAALRELYPKEPFPTLMAEIKEFGANLVERVQALAGAPLPIENDQGEQEELIQRYNALNEKITRVLEEFVKDKSKAKPDDFEKELLKETAVCDQKLAEAILTQPRYGQLQAGVNQHAELLKRVAEADINFFGRDGKYTGWEKAATVAWKQIQYWATKLTFDMKNLGNRDAEAKDAAAKLSDLFGLTLNWENLQKRVTKYEKGFIFNLEDSIGNKRKAKIVAAKLNRLFGVAFDPADPKNDWKKIQERVTEYEKRFVFEIKNLKLDDAEAQNASAQLKELFGIDVEAKKIQEQVAKNKKEFALDLRNTQFNDAEAQKTAAELAGYFEIPVGMKKIQEEVKKHKKKLAYDLRNSDFSDAEAQKTAADLGAVLGITVDWESIQARVKEGKKRLTFDLRNVDFNDTEAENKARELRELLGVAVDRKIFQERVKAHQKSLSCDLRNLGLTDSEAQNVARELNYLFGITIDRELTRFGAKDHQSTVGFPRKSFRFERVLRSYIALLLIKNNMPPIERTNFERYMTPQIDRVLSSYRELADNSFQAPGSEIDHLSNMMARPSDPARIQEIKRREEKTEADYEKLVGDMNTRVFFDRYHHRMLTITRYCNLLLDLDQAASPESVDVNKVREVRKKLNDLESEYRRLAMDAQKKSAVLQGGTLAKDEALAGSDTQQMNEAEVLGALRNYPVKLKDYFDLYLSQRTNGVWAQAEDKLDPLVAGGTLDDLIANARALHQSLRNAIERREAVIHDYIENGTDSGEGLLEGLLLDNSDKSAKAEEGLSATFDSPLLAILNDIAAERARKTAEKNEIIVQKISKKEKGEQIKKLEEKWKAEEKGILAEYKLKLKKLVDRATQARTYYKDEIVKKNPTFEFEKNFGKVEKTIDPQGPRSEFDEKIKQLEELIEEEQLIPQTDEDKNANKPRVKKAPGTLGFIDAAEQEAYFAPFREKVEALKKERNGKLERLADDLILLAQARTHKQREVKEKGVSPVAFFSTLTDAVKKIEDKTDWDFFKQTLTEKVDKYAEADKLQVAWELQLLNAEIYEADLIRIPLLVDEFLEKEVGGYQQKVRATLAAIEGPIVAELEKEVAAARAETQGVEMALGAEQEAFLSHAAVVLKQTGNPESAQNVGALQRLVDEGDLLTKADFDAARIELPVQAATDSLGESAKALSDLKTWLSEMEIGVMLLRSATAPIEQKVAFLRRAKPSLPAVPEAELASMEENLARWNELLQARRAVELLIRNKNTSRLKSGDGEKTARALIARVADDNEKNGLRPSIKEALARLETSTAKAPSKEKTIQELQRFLKSSARKPEYRFPTRVEAGEELVKPQLSLFNVRLNPREGAALLLAETGLEQPEEQFRLNYSYAHWDPRSVALFELHLEYGKFVYALSQIVKPEEKPADLKEQAIHDDMARVDDLDLAQYHALHLAVNEAHRVLNRPRQESGKPELSAEERIQKINERHEKLKGAAEELDLSVIQTEVKPFVVEALEQLHQKVEQESDPAEAATALIRILGSIAGSAEATGPAATLEKFKKLYEIRRDLLPHEVLEIAAKMDLAAFEEATQQKIPKHLKKQLEKLRGPEKHERLFGGERHLIILDEPFLLKHKQNIVGLVKELLAAKLHVRVLVEKAPADLNGVLEPLKALTDEGESVALDSAEKISALARQNYSGVSVWTPLENEAAWKNKEGISTVAFAADISLPMIRAILQRNWNDPRSLGVRIQTGQNQDLTVTCPAEFRSKPVDLPAKTAFDIAV